MLLNFISQEVGIRAIHDVELVNVVHAEKPLAITINHAGDDAPLASLENAVAVGFTLAVEQWSFQPIASFLLSQRLNSHLMAGCGERDSCVPSWRLLEKRLSADESV